MFSSDTFTEPRSVVTMPVNKPWLPRQTFCSFFQHLHITNIRNFTENKIFDILKIFIFSLLRPIHHISPIRKCCYVSVYLYKFSSQNISIFTTRQLLDNSKFSTELNILGYESYGKSHN